MVKIIKKEKEYQIALNEIESLIDLNPKKNSPDGDKLELHSLLIEKYEDENFKIEIPDPVEAIKFRMEQQGLKQKDLIQVIGSRSKVSEVLNRKRPLSLRIIRLLFNEMGITTEVLL